MHQPRRWTRPATVGTSARSRDSIQRELERLQFQQPTAGLDTNEHETVRTIRARPKRSQQAWQLLERTELRMISTRCASCGGGRPSIGGGW